MKQSEQNGPGAIVLILGNKVVLSLYCVVGGAVFPALLRKLVY